MNSLQTNPMFTKGIMCIFCSSLHNFWAEYFCEFFVAECLIVGGTNFNFLVIILKNATNFKLLPSFSDFFPFLLTGTEVESYATQEVVTSESVVVPDRQFEAEVPQFVPRDVLEHHRGVPRRVTVLLEYGRLVFDTTRLLRQQATRTARQILTRLPSKQELRWLRTRKPLAYRESTCMNLSVSCTYEIIVYSVLKHFNTTRMHTFS